MGTRLLYLLCAALLWVGAAQAEPRQRLLLAGPLSAVSNPLIHMVESGALADLADNVAFVSWRDPDQLRLMALNGQADVLAMPVNVAANLYNRGAPVALLNVSTWGLLWMVSREPGLTRIEDFRGKEIAMPFRGDMPDVLFGLLAERAGLNPRQDLTLRYVANPMDALQLLLMRRVDHALLAEPAVSMALRKSGSFPLSLVAPELYRSLDIQQAWGLSFQRAPRIAQAGIALVGAAREDAVLAARVASAYADSLAWCQANAEACGQLVVKHLPALLPEAVSDAMAVSQMQAKAAPDARPEVEFLFEQLQARNPALIGGKLPDDGFYLDARP
ncbi:ABC transporter substrate-binding protein [Pseudomonas sp. RL]|uniref:ABC transporter substrate-binding protein n=1 Tax=Pseudomonas sp. RL TaxID=1452718 RepID=UPI000483C976|nr:ABC transporter substrate-binding protein [Pseudomonas sp. RL]